MDFAALYEDDPETWAELQVAALRRLAERPGPWSNAIDWENVIEEIDDLSSDRRAAESLLRNAFAHVLKADAEPGSLSIPRWRTDASDFFAQARSKLKTSMRQHLDLDAVWLDACEAAASALREYGRELPSEVPPLCPLTFDKIRQAKAGTDLTDIVGARLRS